MREGCPKGRSVKGGISVNETIQETAERWSCERCETAREREARGRKAEQMEKLCEDIKALMRNSGCTAKEADQVLDALHGASVLIIKGERT